MSILCPICCGDGLHHPDADVFEIAHDDPCGSCGGLGVNSDGGDPVPSDYLKRHSTITVKVYMGEARDEFEDCEIAYSGTYRKGSCGAREAGTGLQLEPDEPAGWELEDFHIEINGEWFYFDPDKETATSNGKPPHRCLTVYDRIIELLED